MGQLAEHEPKEEAEVKTKAAGIWEDEQAQTAQREGAAVDATPPDGCCATMNRPMDA
jgi:hypothetical protein